MGIIDEATGKLDSLKEQLKGEDDTVIRFGINVDKNGTVSYFADWIHSYRPPLQNFLL